MDKPLSRHYIWELSTTLWINSTVSYIPCCISWERFELSSICKHNYTPYLCTNSFTLASYIFMTSLTCALKCKHDRYISPPYTRDSSSHIQELLQWLSSAYQQFHVPDYNNGVVCGNYLLILTKIQDEALWPPLLPRRNRLTY